MSDMSEGARILIERMKTNPEDFEYSGKYHEAIRAARALMRNDPTNIPISSRDAEAILIAAEEIWENSLTELVVRSLVEDMHPFISQARQYEIETQQKQAHLMTQMQANQTLGNRYTIGAGGEFGFGLTSMGAAGMMSDPRGLYGNSSLQQCPWPSTNDTNPPISFTQKLKNVLLRK